MTLWHRNGRRQSQDKERQSLTRKAWCGRKKRSKSQGPVTERCLLVQVCGWFTGFSVAAQGQRLDKTHVQFKVLLYFLRRQAASESWARPSARNVVGYKLCRFLNSSGCRPTLGGDDLSSAHASRSLRSCGKLCSSNLRGPKDLLLRAIVSQEHHVFSTLEDC